MADRRLLLLEESKALDIISIAVANGMEYLLTWNCSHIANAAMRRTIEGVCMAHGYEPTVLCTPEELMNA